MAAPSYATNLADITLAAATTGFTAVGGGGAITAETDYSIQDTTCVSKATAATWDSAGTPIGGVLYNNGAGITIPTDGAVLVWIYWWGPGVLATKANGGAEINFGNSTTAYYGQYVTGSDDWQFGGWRCYPVDPGVTPRSRTVGSPNGTWQWFGWQANVAATNSIGKGNPYGIDAIRYGRCDLVATLGDSNGYATFLGAANWDNTSTRRLGLLTPRDGAYYMQGLFQIGTASTLCDFRDANRAIFIQNTEKVSSNFNKIEVRNASSRVDWTSISITALGTVARGNVEVVDNADVNIDSCTFTDMGTFIFKSASTILGSTFRRTKQITANSAIFTSCVFDKCVDAATIVAVSVTDITKCTFISDGGNHAIDLGTISATTSMDWNNTLSGYAVSNGSTGNEAIKVNVAANQTLTINVASGASTPSIYNTGTGTVSIVSGTVTATLTVTDVSGSGIDGAAVLVKAAAGGNLPVNATVTISNSGTTATVTHTGHGMLTGDKVLIKFVSDTGKIAANEGVFAITKITDNSYSYTMGSSPGASPTGTIYATYVLLSGTTNVNGVISTSRSFGANQPVTGWARKSTSAPYYKQGAVAGTVNTGTGASLSAILIADQ